MFLALGSATSNAKRCPSGEKTGIGKDADFADPSQLLPGAVKPGELRERRPGSLMENDSIIQGHGEGAPVGGRMTSYLSRDDLRLAFDSLPRPGS